MTLFLFFVLGELRMNIMEVLKGIVSIFLIPSIVGIVIFTFILFFDFREENISSDGKQSQEEIKNEQQY